MREPAAPTLLPEWAPQAGVLLAWPHADSDWGPHLEAIEADYVALAVAIARFEALVIACQDDAHRAAVRDRLRATGLPAARLHLHIVPCDHTWVRDFAPLAVGTPDEVGLSAFAFNAWGGKYRSDQDARFSARLHALGAFGDVPLRREPLVVEGGALESDGAGTLLTTAGCLDRPSRNPGLDRKQLEARLGQVLGVDRVVWLEVEPLPGDDTDGHVDTLVRFCDPGTLAHVTCADPADPVHASLAGLERQLRALCRRDGSPYRLLPLPLPAPCHASDGRRLPATHANFLIINGAVLVPCYGDPADAVAMGRLGTAFPGREVVGIPARTLIEENGSLHCATMQLPAGIALTG
jgi:agmatine/peptidylarginine deiminase